VVAVVKNAHSGSAGWDHGVVSNLAQPAPDWWTIPRLDKTAFFQYILMNLYKLKILIHLTKQWIEEVEDAKKDCKRAVLWFRDQRAGLLPD
jgi:hypothetical protein